MLLFNIFAERLVIYAAPTSFKIVGENGSYEFEPYVCFSEVNGEINMVSIGHPVENQETEIYRFDLFDKNSSIPDGFEFGQVLHAFIEYMIGYYFHRRIFPALRPFVMIDGVEKFEGINGLDIMDEFVKSAEKAGASEVYLNWRDFEAKGTNISIRKKIKRLRHQINEWGEKVNNLAEKR